MQGSARKDVVFGAARGYTFTVPGPKWKSWVTYSWGLPSNSSVADGPQKQYVLPERSHGLSETRFFEQSTSAVSSSMRERTLSANQ